MRLILKLFIFCFTLFFASISKGQNSSSKILIIGKWKFDKMEFVGDLANVDKKEQNRVNKINEGNIITFTQNGGFKTIKKMAIKRYNLQVGNIKF